MSPAEQLLTRWRDRAEELQPFASAAAEAFRRAAQELEDALAEQHLQVLSLQEAAAESGYSVDHLAREIREGRIPNAGRKGKPRIRRRDLPRKPGHVPVAQQRLRNPSSTAGARARRAALTLQRGR